MNRLVCQTHNKQIISIEKQTKRLLCSLCLQQKYPNVEQERSISQQQYRSLCFCYQKQASSLSNISNKIKTGSQIVFQKESQSPNIQALITSKLNEMMLSKNKQLQNIIKDYKLSTDDSMRIRLHNQIEQSKKEMKKVMVQTIKLISKQYYSKHLFE